MAINVEDRLNDNFFMKIFKRNKETMSSPFYWLAIFISSAWTCQKNKTGTHICCILYVFPLFIIESSSLWIVMYDTRLLVMLGMSNTIFVKVNK